MCVLPMLKKMLPDNGLELKVSFLASCIYKCTFLQWVTFVITLGKGTSIDLLKTYFFDDPLSDFAVASSRGVARGGWGGGIFMSSCEDDATSTADRGRSS